MRINPFGNKQSSKTEDGKIRQAFTYGGEMFTDGEVIPQALRSTMERELRSLQRGSSGVSDSGLSTAIKLSVPAYTCVSYFSSQAASIPIAVKEKDIIDHHPFDFFLSQSPSLIEDIVFSYLIFGKIFIQKVYNQRETIGNPRGFPTGLKFINPNNITQIVDQKTQRITGYKLPLENNREVPPSDIIYLAGFDPSGDGNPLSKLENAFVHLGVEQGIANFAMSFFLNRAVPVGIVSFDPPLSPEDYKKQKQAWKREFTGSKNAFKTAFTNGKITWAPITDSPKDLAMSNLTDNSKQMICASFNVPPELVGLSDSAGNSLSVEQRTATQKIFLEGIVIPLLSKILDAMNQQWVWVDFGPVGFYNLVTNERIMTIFSSVTLDRITMTSQLVKDGTINYDQQLTMLSLPIPELSEGELRLKAPPDQPLAMWKEGTISLNQFLALVGLPTVAMGNVYNMNGVVVASPADAIQKEAPLPPPTPPDDSIDSVLSLIEGITEVAETTGSPPPVLSTRSHIPVDIAIDFANHNFVKMAQRQLAKQLDEHDLDWIDGNDWKLQLITYSEVPPAQVPALQQGVDLDGENINLHSNGYRVHDNAIYWTIDSNKELSLLRTSLRVRLENMIDIMGDDKPLFGIKLCNCNGAAITDDMLGEDIIGTPLVADNVSVYVNGDLSNVWRIQRATPAQRSELTQWKNKFKTAGKRGIRCEDVQFEIMELPQHVVDYIKENVATGCDMTAIFKEARSRLSQRAIQATLIDFETFMEDTIAEARAGNIPRSRFTTLLRNAINRFGNAAYRDGLVDGGVLDGTLTDDDREIADEMINDNQSFAKNLSARVFGEDGISDEEAASRPAIWGRSVVRVLYDAGRLSADKNGMYELVQATKTVDKCPDCIRLLGQVHRFSAWARRNLIMPRPGRQATDCEGWECGHTQIKTTARASGSF